MLLVWYITAFLCSYKVGHNAIWHLTVNNRITLDQSRMLYLILLLSVYLSVLVAINVTSKMYVMIFVQI